LSSRTAFLNFYVSHGSATRFLRGGEKYYIFADIYDDFMAQQA